MYVYDMYVYIHIYLVKWQVSKDAFMHKTASCRPGYISYMVVSIICKAHGHLGHKCPNQGLAN